MLFNFYGTTGGNDKLICFGLFWFGEDLVSIFLTIFCIVFPFVSYIVKILLNDKNKSNANICFRLFRFFLLLLFILNFSLLTFLSNPGIIPRAKNFSKRDSHSFFTNGAQCKRFLFNNLNFQLKFCETCEIWRSPRTSHCSSCDNCIMKFDHHCPWIGTCVGYGNYRSFLMFISSLFWYFILFSFDIIRKIFLKKNIPFIKMLFSKKQSNKKWIIGCFFFSLSTFFILFGLLFTGALLSFHLYLGLLGKTTSELFKTWGKNFWLPNFRRDFTDKICRNSSRGMISKSSKKKLKCIKIINS